MWAQGYVSVYIFTEWRTRLLITNSQKSRQSIHVIQLQFEQSVLTNCFIGNGFIFCNAVLAPNRIYHWCCVCYFGWHGHMLWIYVSDYLVHVLRTCRCSHLAMDNMKWTYCMAIAFHTPSWGEAPTYECCCARSFSLRINYIHNGMSEESSIKCDYLAWLRHIMRERGLLWR